MKWIRGSEVYTGGEYRFVQDGVEYISYNPTDDFLIDQGWVRADEEITELDNSRSLLQIKEEIIQECNEFYKSSVLQVEFRGQLLWIPFETRQAYRVILEDLKNNGRTEVIFRDTVLTISEAIDILRTLNLYEYDQKQVCDQHVREIINLSTEEELYSYDFTTNYSVNLTF